MLITYPDSLGKNLKELNLVIKENLGQNTIGGIHILPFPLLAVTEDSRLMIIISLILFLEIGIILLN
ncbi:MAG: hypothetical protein PR2021_4450 [Candidatus Phytoplasma pruni]|nr:MAG: hypothetical protein PR2021_4450 [Candidatus Phytoplasma pruni]